MESSLKYCTSQRLGQRRLEADMPKLLPPAYFFLALAPIIAASFLSPYPILIPFPVRLAGLFPIAAGIALNLAAGRQFKRRGTTVKPFQRSNALLTDGVFRWCRNPMYLGMVLIAAGAAVLEGTAISRIAVAALAVWTKPSSGVKRECSK